MNSLNILQRLTGEPAVLLLNFMGLYFLNFLQQNREIKDPRKNYKHQWCTI